MTYNVKAFLTVYFRQLLRGHCTCEEADDGITIVMGDLPHHLDELCSSKGHFEPMVVSEATSKTSRLYISENLVLWAKQKNIEKGGSLVFSRATNRKDEVRGLSAEVPTSLVGECVLAAHKMTSRKKPVLNLLSVLDTFPSERSELRRH